MREVVTDLDWERLGERVDNDGYAVTPALLEREQCRRLRALFDETERFRSTVVMARHRFGEGCYRYFAEPLPSLVAALREALYPPLATLANCWQEAVGGSPSYPARFAEYQTHCHAAGQRRPTPLLLSYEAGGYNCLHQDKYGSIAFPLQATVLLSERGREFEGGEFLLVENRPRLQSRGVAITLEQGQCVVFPNQWRPVRGTRGHYRVQVRHGVSTVRRGRRTTLGIIFHDAE